MLVACAVAAVGDGDAVTWVGLGRVEAGVHLVDDPCHLELVVAWARQLIGCDGFGEAHGAAVGAIQLRLGELDGLLAFARHRIGGGVDEQEGSEHQQGDQQQSHRTCQPIATTTWQGVSLTSHLELCLQRHLEVIYAEAFHLSPARVGVVERPGGDELQAAAWA